MVEKECMNTDKPILPELNRRKSIRTFLQKEIEPEKLDALWAAAQWAPSSSNAQEWHYYALLGKARESFAKVLDTGNQWALRAPLLLGVTRNTSIENRVEAREYGVYDVALSVMCLVIEAEHQGLRAHQMAGFQADAFRSALSIPDNEEPIVVVAVGYEAREENLDERTRAKEHRSRIRKSINEILTILRE